MKKDILGCLTQSDWTLLLENSQKQIYPKGAIVVEAGTLTRSLLIITRGYVTIASNGQEGVRLSQSGPGEILGEISFLEDAGATASVIATEEVEVQIISATRIQALLDSVPGLATRFYKSLALTLAQRLRFATEQFITLDQARTAAIEHSQALHIGNISDRQIPADLITSLEQFRSRLLRAEQQIKQRQLSPEAGQREISQICDRLLDDFAAQVESEALMNRGWDDLLSFRDTAQIEVGLGDYVFRETFPFLMRSATLASCYSRGSNYANDYLLGDLIQANTPTGDSSIGTYIDGWFLSRPFCQSQRQSRVLLQQCLQEAARTGKSSPLRITTLAAGNAQELLAVLQQENIQCYGTALDENTKALARSARQAQRLGVEADTNMLYSHLKSCVTGQETLILPPLTLPLQDLIYGFDLCDHWEDGEIVALLDWIYDRLEVGGQAILTNQKPGLPDRLLLKHILHWQRYDRSETDWQDLVAQSQFTPKQLQFKTDETGWMLFAIVTKS